MDYIIEDPNVLIHCDAMDMLDSCMNDYLFIYDFLHDFFYITPSATQRFNLINNRFNHVIDAFQTLVYPQDLSILTENIHQVQSTTNGSHDLRYRWLDKEGKPIWINCRGHVITNGDQSRFMIGCINEIGNQQIADNLSGLLGESSLRSDLKEFESVIPYGYVLRLGIDDFKSINENFGTEYGDMIIQKTAECITRCLQPEQRIYRMVADEFMILDFTGARISEAVDLYQKIRNEIDSYIDDIQYEVVYTISGGILETGKEEFTISNIIKLSEFSLNEAKRNGRNQCYAFLQEDYDRYIKQQDLKKILRRAIRNNFEGFEAYFQPLFFSNTRVLYGAETLMRFQCDEYGAVSPAEFIPALEETGLIIPVGRWILHQALSACKSIQKRVPNFRISVNVSYIQVMKSGLIDEIVSATRQYDIPPNQLVIELTESGSLESNIHIKKMLSRIKDTGILLALDDFGTGYSNFHYLYDLQPDIIKIDRSFTAKAMENEYEYNLLSLMSNLVHGLNLKMCVEGIETSDEENRISKVSPDYNQGFYYGRPCSIDQFMNQFVKNN